MELSKNFKNYVIRGKSYPLCTMNKIHLQKTITFMVEIVAETFPKLLVHVVLSSGSA